MNMKEKTRVLTVLSILFVISMVVVAFGSFIEKQDNSVRAGSLMQKKIPVENSTGKKIMLESHENEIIHAE